MSYTSELDPARVCWSISVINVPLNFVRISNNYA